VGLDEEKPGPLTGRRIGSLRFATVQFSSLPRAKAHHPTQVRVPEWEMTSPMVATPVQLRTTGRLSFCCSFPSAPGTATTTRRRRFAAVRASAETMATEKLGIKVERNPPESRLSELGVRQWPK